MTSMKRQCAMIDAVRYVSARKLTGSIVECGVGLGGNSMLAFLVSRQRQELDRDLYLFDSFIGMVVPSGHDVAIDGISARQHLIDGACK